MKSSDRGYFTSHSECYDDDFYVSDQRFYELNYPEGILIFSFDNHVDFFLTVFHS